MVWHGMAWLFQPTDICVLLLAILAVILQGQCETGVCKPSVDCVGAFGEFGACSNVCGAGQKTKLYTIVSHILPPLHGCCCDSEMH
jgi:hypothetical protein